MERRVQHVKGSYVVTLPKDWVRSRGISQGSRVTIHEEGEKLVLSGPSAAASLAVKTVGYEGKDIESFVDSLVSSGVDLLVDVRELPLSRKKGFSKRQLAARLEKRGIGYRHVPLLGAPKQIRDPYKQGGSFGEFESAYSAHLSKHQDALDLLKGIIIGRSAAMMCFEADHRCCHRGIVAEVLGHQGYFVEHLR